MSKMKPADVAKELNEVMELNPAIKTVAVKAVELDAKIKEAAGLIDPVNDEFSEDCVEFLKEKGWWPAPEPKQVNPKVPKAPKPTKPAPEPEPAEAEGEPEAEGDELLELVEDTDDLKELKAIVKANKVFNPLLKKLPGIFDWGELKEKMLFLLGVDPAEEPEAAPAPAPKTKMDPVTKPKAEKAPKPAPAPKTGAYSRIDSICQTIKGGDATDAANLAELANALYVEKGGKDNLKESKFLVNMILKTLSHFDEVKINL